MSTQRWFACVSTRKARLRGRISLEVVTILDLVGHAALWRIAGFVADGSAATPIGASSVDGEIWGLR